jgi:drug/metabolite transporter (DMT)-like permease
MLNWQPQQAQPPSQYQPQIQKPVHMNWFQRHLHGTLWVSYAAVLFISVWFSLSASQDTSSLASGFSVLLALIVLLPVSGWVIRQKKRRLWWLLLFFVPLGWISFFLLENHNYETT